SPILTPEQLRYCQALAQGATKRAAAAAAGVSERAIYLWLEKPPLAAAIDAHIEELQRARLAEARRLAVAALPLAFARLRHIVRRGSEGEARKAAEYLIDLTGVRAPEARRGQPGAGPRIVIERAVLALTDEHTRVVH